MPREEHQIEVTPEMIEAGLPLLLRFSREADFYEDAVSELYRAMEAARISSKKDDGPSATKNRRP